MDKTLRELLQQINDGLITVRWESWSFTGGSTWGNDQTFSLTKDDAPYGTIELNDNITVTLKVGSKTVLSAVEIEEAEFNTAFDTLSDAVRRDDKEIAEKLTSPDGSFRLPADYCDISRQEVLDGSQLDD